MSADKNFIRLEYFSRIEPQSSPKIYSVYDFSVSKIDLLRNLGTETFRYIMAKNQYQTYLIQTLERETNY